MNEGDVDRYYGLERGRIVWMAKDMRVLATVKLRKLKFVIIIIM